MPYHIYSSCFLSLDIAANESSLLKGSNDDNEVSSVLLDPVSFVLHWRLHLNLVLHKCVHNWTSLYKFPLILSYPSSSSTQYTPHPPSPHPIATLYSFISFNFLQIRIVLCCCTSKHRLSPRTTTTSSFLLSLSCLHDSQTHAFALSAPS